MRLSSWKRPPLHQRGSFGVRANAVCPGYVLTPLVQKQIPDPARARGISEEALEMVLLPATSFHALFGKHEAFRNYVFHLFSDRLTDLMQLVTAVAFQKLDQRLAKLIVSKPNPILTTHQALADELGSVREIVSRLLKGFVAQGLVTLGREQITLVDRPGLQKIASV